MRYILLLLITGLVSCEPWRDDVGPQMGYAPIYATAQVANNIAAEPSRPTTNAGKIYAYNNYLFQVELGQGIHVINNTDPQQAQKIGFIRIPLCTEIAIRSNHLYTNNLDDLVVLDISNINAPQLVNRIENAFPEISQSYPPFNGVVFECADPSKGVVIGWEQKMITDPKCRR